MAISRREPTMHALLALVALAFSFADAQSCYYPDGNTLATMDTPCNSTASASSCCRSDQFCLVDGMCFGGGIVSRGSCTDSSWQDESCSQVCRIESASADIAITPCSDGTDTNTFVCGVNTTQCHTNTNTFSLANDITILLRPAQVAALVQSALATEAPVSNGFSVGALIGVAAGVAIPAIIAIVVLSVLLKKSKRKATQAEEDATASAASAAAATAAAAAAAAKNQYIPPDHSKEKYVWSHAEPVMASPPYHQGYHQQNDMPIPLDMHGLPSPGMSSMRSPGGEMRSRASSVRSGVSETVRLTSSTGTLVERYSSMKQGMSSPQMGERHELDTSPHVLRYELGDRRMS